jgi:hypothetical protein
VFPRLWDKDDLCNFPLGGEVVEKQDGIEELGDIYDVCNGQFFEDFTSNEVIARRFFWFEMFDDSLDIGIGKTRDWRVKLIWCL